MGGEIIVGLGLALVFVDLRLRLSIGLNTYAHALRKKNSTDDGLSKATSGNLNER